MRVVVGIFGGTRGQGRAIVEELKKAPEKYTVKIFSRKVSQLRIQSSQAFALTPGRPMAPLRMK